MKLLLLLLKSCRLCCVRVGERLEKGCCNEVKPMIFREDDLFEPQDAQSSFF